MSSHLSNGSGSKVQGKAHPAATFCPYRDALTWCTLHKAWCWQFSNCELKSWSNTSDDKGGIIQ